jgi:hypothetical protein
MAEIPQGTPLPDALPVLSRGKHKTPARGACFMEYTSVLAGEAFTDSPRCVDPELASVLRTVNDNTSDAERTHLVPLLGRAIGLAVARPAGRPVGRAALRASASERRLRRQELARYADATRRLRHGVSARFIAAVGCSPSAATRMWRGWEEEVCWLFWDLMDRPTPLEEAPDVTRRLLDRLVLLHECYEQTMRDLGLPRLMPVVAGAPADTTTEVAPSAV